MNHMKLYLLYFVGIGTISILLFACTNIKSQNLGEELPQIHIAHLGHEDLGGLELIRENFSQRNPGYDLGFLREVMEIPSKAHTQIVFIQKGGGTGTLTGGAQSKVSIGDIVWLKEKQGMKMDSMISALIFQVPEDPSSDVPHFIRPDWDPNITDIPGGCATETGAYRRILLTWLKNVGTYTFPFLNAHRVRIMDSFSHYHPVDKGFDEFYLVQMVMKDGKILTSNQVSLIEQPESVSRDQAQSLFTSTSLEVGDLVYLPKGLIHRGLNGVLAQVITVPGFVPGTEIGVDHHLKKINDLLELNGKEQIPYNKLASKGAIIK